MSIYAIEATREEMCQEAAERLKLLGIDGQVVTAFESTGQVYLSQNEAGGTILMLPEDSVNEQIKTFEEEYGCLVYHAQRCFAAMFGAEMLSLLFVSPTASDWKSEKRYIKDCGLVYAYVDSPMESGVAEIQVEAQDGGVNRIG